MKLGVSAFVFMYLNHCYIHGVGAFSAIKKSTNTNEKISVMATQCDKNTITGIPMFC